RARSACTATSFAAGWRRTPWTRGSSARGFMPHPTPPTSTLTSLGDIGLEPRLAPTDQRYILLDKLGQGGMGAVYTAYDRQLDRRVALKLMRGDRSSRSSTRLTREAQALAKLSHENVVTVFDIGTLDHRMFVTMELVDGSSLRGWLAERPRSWRAVVAVFAAVGRGLAAAHAAGLVHRDVKPDNILIARDGTARIADFGVVRLLGEPTPEPGATPATPGGDDDIATVGTIGTPRYMAPEQRDGRDVGPTADQYSLCVALKEPR